MKQFLFMLVLFCTPVCLLLAPSATVLYLSGEWAPLSWVMQQAGSSHTFLFGPAYSNYRRELQQAEAATRKPKILALGNSRVGEFRSAFFTDPTVFYNATGATGALSDYTNFLASVAPYHPDILIVNMDHYFFNPDQAKNSVVVRPDPFQKPGPGWLDIALESLVRNGGWWKVPQDFYKHTFVLADIKRTSPSAALVGLRARAMDTGSTNDGSDYYGAVVRSPIIQTSVLDSIHDLANSITDTHGDWYGDEISSTGLAELQRFLAYCKSHNIHVIGFLPPIAHEEYSAIMRHKTATYASTTHMLEPTLASAYLAYGFDFYDFSDITTIDSSDAEMVEAKHGSEKMYLRLFIKMANTSNRLHTYTNTTYLTQKLTSATSTYIVFGLGGTQGTTSAQQHSLVGPSARL